MNKAIREIYTLILNKDNFKVRINQTPITLSIEEFYPADQTMLCDITSFILGDKEIYPSGKATIEDFDEVIERFDNENM